MIKKIKQGLHSRYYDLKYAKAKFAFDKAIPNCLYLPDDQFDQFVKKYGKIPAGPAQDYTIEGMEALARERVDFIFNKINFTPSSVLEIGPGAGFVLKKFKEKGIPKAVSLDIADELYPEVKKAGVELILTSAEDMSQVPDQSFELVLSWSALEHIPNPALVFAECLRILKPGGYLYLHFGPLYYSTWGYHHYSVIKCPYLHILFPESLIHAYAKKVKGESYAGYLPYTSGEPIESYDFIRRKLPYGYLLESCLMGFDYYSSDIITHYPQVFKSKRVSFESFFTDSFRIGIYRI
jgi:ubiquinone/menaquinone biosynthesis C-methylase UbiE